MAFHAALRSAHMAFVSRLEGQARTLLRHHLDTATSEFALSLLMSSVSLEPAPAAYQHQQPAASAMPPPGGRRGAAAAAAAAAADEGENVPPQDDASDEGQVREGVCVVLVSLLNCCWCKPRNRNSLSLRPQYHQALPGLHIDTSASAPTAKPLPSSCGCLLLLHPALPPLQSSCPSRTGRPTGPSR